MRNIDKFLRHAFLIALGWPATQAMADQPLGCWIDPLRASTIKVHVRDMGVLYVPRDAQVGTIIGPAASFQVTPDQNNLALKCRTYGDRINFDFRASRGVHPPLPTVEGRNMDGHVLRTNIPGVGAIIALRFPFTGGADQFTPVGQNPPLIPFTSWYDQTQLAPVGMGTLRNEVTLVKTGDLQPGVHQLDGQLATGHLDSNGLDKVVDFTLRATIIQTQCDIGANAVTPNPVQLGEWSTSDFTGPGFTTTPVPFQIRLSNCQVDPDPGNQTLATIELTGINGSQPVGPAGEHVFSLTQDSDARGMGIQMLYNGLPMPLNQELDLAPIEDGSVPLNFQARFYQFEPSSAVRAGAAKGALNFTIRYR